MFVMNVLPIFLTVFFFSYSRHNSNSCVWCQLIPIYLSPPTLNKIFVSDFLIHLHSKEHQETQKIIEPPWHEKPVNDVSCVFSQNFLKNRPWSWLGNILNGYVIHLSFFPRRKCLIIPMHQQNVHQYVDCSSLFQRPDGIVPFAQHGWVIYTVLPCT